eukprot:10351037-Lingulodinium_polyedra.AAC.1
MHWFNGRYCALCTPAPARSREGESASTGAATPLPGETAGTAPVPAPSGPPAAPPANSLGGTRI